MQDEEKESKIKELVQVMLGCYPQLPHDPARYARGLITGLSTRELTAVKALCNPATGIARKSKYLPTLAECLAWCDEWGKLYGKARVVQIEKPHTNPEERERVGKLFSEFSAKFRGNIAKTMN